ncbi:outer membrane protein [Helicobacter baculiformis]|uniref:Outer membrane protein n=1 Tax=Helicobacter baculiformis TaxID=427351 RepID=A0ABV7ZGH9_9HELI|nr:outer membrane protein [Helicobacter baculiformis]
MSALADFYGDYKRFLVIGLGAFLSFAPLVAEDNAGYVLAGFEYANMGGNMLTDIISGSQGTHINEPITGSLYGGDFQLGYKQFFGSSQRFGLRYYGIFSGYAGTYIRKDENKELISKGSLSNFFYGAGMDMLYNFYDSENRSFGLFGGVMVGGSSWELGKGYKNGECQTREQGNGPVLPGAPQPACISMDKYYQESAKRNNTDGNKASFTSTYVQVVFNFGLRSNFTKHQGFEIGVRVPVINDPYYTYQQKSASDQDKYTINFGFRRLVAAFVNYVINF